MINRLGNHDRATCPLCGSESAVYCEADDVRKALDAYGIPKERDGVTLTMRQRVEVLSRELEEASNMLSGVWLVLDSWARGGAPSLDMVQRVSATILRAQQCPGWTNGDLSQE